jgi:hypothetical protein
MKSFSFTLVLDNIAVTDDSTADMLFEAGCDDALLLSRNGITYVDFDREANSLEEVILPAISQVEKHQNGLKVRRVEPSDLVTSAEIARRLERSRQSVQQFITGSRGDGKFPMPIAGVTAKTMLWSWLEVTRWLLENKKISDESIYSQAKVLKQINESLDARTYSNHLADVGRYVRLLDEG